MCKGRRQWRQVQWVGPLSVSPIPLVVPSFTVIMRVAVQGQKYFVPRCTGCWGMHRIRLDKLSVTSSGVLCHPPVETVVHYARERSLGGMLRCLLHVLKIRSQDCTDMIEMFIM